ncbi:MAG: EthD family reductase [Acetobacteraceae bacterium]|nr:EthD family reductase [Acetobacteraceae bacterium]
MIKVTVLYPAGPAFDMDYYLNRHTPMLREKLGTALTSLAIEQGVAGIAPQGAPTYQVLCHLGFANVEAFQAAFAQHGAEVMADIPNYTAARPVIQIGEVMA